MNYHKRYKEELENAKKDPNVLGFFLSGGRGKGQSTKWSDYDIGVVVKDNVAKKYKKKYAAINDMILGFSVNSYSDFKNYLKTAKSEWEWDRYNFAHLKVQVDKKDIQKIVDKKGVIPKNEIKKYVSGHLDGYINYIYRSLKCWRDGNKVGARLESARSINFLLTVLFGVEGRPTPYYKHLEWELDNYPLKKVKVGKNELINDLLKILETGNIKTQQKYLKKVEISLRKEGYGKVFDSWPDLKWMIEFNK